MSTTSQPNIDSTLHENRVFECSDEFRSHAHIRSMEQYERLYKEAETDPEKFWGGIASQLHWFKPWDQVLDWNCPWSKWFSGGQINLSYNCLDRHVATWRRNKAALIWEGEPGEAIVAAADSENADLIVVGSHGRSGVSRFLIGSVSDFVVRHAHCPVMGVRGRLDGARR